MDCSGLMDFKELHESIPFEEMKTPAQADKADGLYLLEGFEPKKVDRKPGQYERCYLSKMGEDTIQLCTDSRGERIHLRQRTQRNS